VPREMKTVLVTGSRGFIGRRLVGELLERGSYRVIALTRAPAPASSGGLQYVHADMLDVDRSTWSRRGIDSLDCVYHLGGFFHKDRFAEPDYRDVFAGNLGATARLLSSLPPVRKVVFTSTIDVYEPALGKATIDEESKIAPQSIYAASKLFSECLVADFSESQGVDSAILRLTNVYGPGEQGHNKLIPSVIRQCLKAGQVNQYGRGDIERDYLYVDDAVDAIIRASVSTDTHSPINVVRGRSISVSEVIATITSSFEHIRVIRHDELADGASRRFDNSRMIETLGDFEYTKFDTGIANETDSFRELYERDE
jgi:UDP-glucose 4-epimerase